MVGSRDETVWVGQGCEVIYLEAAICSVRTCGSQKESRYSSGGDEPLHSPLKPPTVPHAYAKLSTFNLCPRLNNRLAGVANPTAVSLFNQTEAVEHVWRLGVAKMVRRADQSFLAPGLLLTMAYRLKGRCVTGVPWCPDGGRRSW